MKQWGRGRGRRGFPQSGVISASLPNPSTDEQERWPREPGHLHETSWSLCWWGLQGYQAGQLGRTHEGKEEHREEASVVLGYRQLVVRRPSPSPPSPVLTWGVGTS